MITYQQEFSLPPLTVSWKEVETAWTALPNPWRLHDADHAHALQRQFFSERIVYDLILDVLHIRFSYDYEIDTERITKPIHLLGWASHLAGKNWMNITFLNEVIKTVCAIKKWNLHGS